MICISHLANKFFQEDIGEVVMDEVNLEEQIGTLFDQAELFVTDENRNDFNNLKEDLIDNEDVKQILGVSTQQMLNDIVNDNTKNQDIESVLKEIVHSYNKDIQLILKDEIDKDTLSTYIDDVIEFLPVQVVYDDSVQTFKEEIPQSYMKLLRIVNAISAKGVTVNCIILSIALTILLIFVNRKQFKWLFPVGMGVLISDLLLLVTGIIVPTIYQTMLSQMDHVFSKLSDVDFQIITYYGIAFTLIGSLCMVLYKIKMRKSINLYAKNGHKCC